MATEQYKGRNLSTNSEAYKLLKLNKIPELTKHLKEMDAREKALMDSISARFPYPRPPEEILNEIKAKMEAINAERHINCVSATPLSQ